MDYTNIIVVHPKTNSWSVVLTILKNISQWEGLSHILWKNKKCSKPTTRIYHITVISVLDWFCDFHGEGFSEAARVSVVEVETPWEKSGPFLVAMTHPMDVQSFRSSP